jgi:hypothetical protein
MKAQGGGRFPSTMPYVVSGFVLCLILQVIFWLQLAPYKPRLLTMPFIFAYSQKAIMDLLVYEPAWFVTMALWLLVYVALGFFLWLLLDRRDHPIAHRWRRAVLGWIVIEVCLVLLARFLLARGRINIE